MLNSTRHLLARVNITNPVRVGILLAAAAGWSAPALAQPGKTTPENPRQPDAPSAPAAAPKPGEAAANQKEEIVHVTISTSQGDIVLALNKTKAPVSVENFMKYVEAGHYEGTIFHRVIDGFMIQGGGLDQNMKEKKTEFPAITNEWQNGLKNKRGTIAMARTNDPNSARAQFYINVADNMFLSEPRRPNTAGYAVFGEVIGGMEVVDKIKGVPTTTKGGMENVPVDPIVINKVRVATAEEVAKATGK